MSVIIIPRRHYTQPRGRAQIDYANPLTVGLAFAETPTSESGRFGRSGAVAEAAGAGGRAYSLNGSSYLLDSASPVNNWPLTFLAIAERKTATNGAFMSLGSGTQRHLLYALADGRLRIFSGSGGTIGETSSFLKPTAELNVPHWVAGRVHAANSRDVWISGALLDSNSTTVDTTAAATAAIGTYWNNDAPGLTLNGSIYLAVAWARALSDEELREMYSNPWQIFRADPLRIYSLPSGPIGISWSSLTASNITQTGARLTLGGITR